MHEVRETPSPLDGQHIEMCIRDSYITVIYPVKKSADAPKFDAKFKNKTFDENGLEIDCLLYTSPKVGK